MAKLASTECRRRHAYVASTIRGPMRGESMPWEGCAPAERRQSGAVAHFRRRQRRIAALGGARYAIRYLIAFGGLRGLPWRASPWQPGQRGRTAMGDVR
jgi:hypothetical protein